MLLNSFLNPKSVAIIGASNNKEKIGYQILDNLKSGKYKGKIYPVNLNEKTILGLPAFKNVGEIMNKVDLAVIVIPAVFVVAAVKDCALRGIKNIIIVSAGFSEESEEGKTREKEIVKIAEENKLHILGPNCMGIIGSNNNLNVTFAKSQNKKGNVAFVSQSGAIGSAALDWVQNKDFGFSYFISLGNKSVLDENDFFDYFLHDKNTEIVVAYLEQIKNGKRFMESVSKLSQKKPVVILKSGKSDLGKKAALSHTGSLTGSNEANLTAFRRVNAINVDTIEEVFILIKFLQSAVKIKSSVNWKPELFMVSNAGGPMVVTVDLLSKYDLSLGDFSPELTEKLKKKLPNIKNIKNPFDIIGDADAKRYRDALDLILREEYVNNVLILLTPQTATEVEKTADIIKQYKKKYPQKLICTSFIGGDSLLTAKSILAKAGVVNFNYPHQAVECLAHYFSYQVNKDKLIIYNSGIREAGFGKRDSGSGIREAGFGNQMEYISGFNLLKKYGIPTIKTEKVEDVNKIKFPAVMKVVGPKLIHKTDKGSIALNIKNSDEARLTMKKFGELLKDKSNYVVAQPMSKGFELILGMKKDPAFGPIIMVGAGGIYIEVLKDVALEVSDVTPERAMKMIEDLKIYPILKGTRGQKGLAVKELAKTIVNLARLCRENPEIEEIDINPLFITEKDVRAIDARVIF